MKYKINDFRVDFRITQPEMEKLLAKKLHGEKIISYQILKKSIDARKNLLFVYQIVVELKKVYHEKERKKIGIELYKPELYVLPQLKLSIEQINKMLRPVIVGSGPAGLFAGLILAEAGLKPIILERGEPAEKRKQTIDHYNQTGELNPESNIQFGEGGAGTFSDGKLNTGVKDVGGRRGKVLQTFVECGAKKDILYDAKPHIGTDYLIQVVANIRRKIESLGGQIRFNTKVEKLEIKNKKIHSVLISSQEQIKTNYLILAIGHSARDTFSMLLDTEIAMEAKPFAVGLRVEHKQSMIDQKQYGKFAGHKNLGAADYKLTYRTENGRKVYSFCMCPGGRVVNSASEYGRLVCNGMSYQARDLENANSAILVGIDQKDYGEGILAGMEFQRKLEEKAFALGGSNYAMPIETYGDFKIGTVTGFNQTGNVRSSLECNAQYADLRQLFKAEINQAIIEAMEVFGKKIKGFNQEDALLTGVESRSSSPVRILRGEDFQSLNCQGLYPCGEGAGYAGGIMSAALDGIKTAEKIIHSLNTTKPHNNSGNRID